MYLIRSCFKLTSKIYLFKTEKELKTASGYVCACVCLSVCVLLVRLTLKWSWKIIAYFWNSCKQVDRYSSTVWYFLGVFCYIIFFFFILRTRKCSLAGHAFLTLTQIYINTQINLIRFFLLVFLFSPNLFLSPLSLALIFQTWQDIFICMWLCTLW